MDRGPIRTLLQLPLISILCCAVLLTVLIMGWIEQPVPGALVVTSLGAMLLLFLMSATTEDLLSRPATLLAWIMMSMMVIGVHLLINDELPSLSLWLGTSALSWLGLSSSMIQSWRFDTLSIPGRLTTGIRMGWALPVTLALLTAIYLLFSPQFSATRALLVLVPLVLGALCGLAFRSLGMYQSSAESHSYITDMVGSGLKQVDELVAQYKLGAARKTLDKLYELAPNNQHVRQARYTVWKYNPEHESFHQSAVDLLDQPGNSEETNEYIAALFDDYMAVTQGQPQLPDDLFLRVSRRLSRMGRLKDAAMIVNLFLQRDNMHADLPSSLLSLSQAYLLADKPGKAHDYAERLMELFPTSREINETKRIMQKLKT